MTVQSYASCHVAVKLVPDGQGFKVYPNPSTGMFVVELLATESGAAITITDVLGKVVVTRFTENANAQQVSFNLGNFARGSYLIKVSAGDKTYRQKVEIW